MYGSVHQEVDMLTRKVSSLNKNIQSKDTQIIELEQKIEEANRQVHYEAYICIPLYSNQGEMPGFFFEAF